MERWGTGGGAGGPGSRFLAREIKTIVSLRTFIRETAGLRRQGLQTVPAKEAKHIHMDGALKPKWTILIVFFFF